MKQVRVFVASLAIASIASSGFAGDLQQSIAKAVNEQEQVKAKHNGLTPGDYLDSIGFLGDDVVVAHGVWLSKEEIEKFAAKKTGVVHCLE